VLDAQVRAAVRAGAPRILVAGGDGTLASVAAIVAGSRTVLAILPGGTLNHFARDLGIPTDPREALAVAMGEATCAADVGFVNDRLFLNTSSVGAYVLFVRARERLEKRFGYRIASVLALAKMVGATRPFRVELQTEDGLRIYRSSLVFVGVGERELRVPELGSRVPHGRRGLHVLITRGQTSAGLAALALSAAARGVRALARTPKLDSFLVDDCRISMRRPRGNVAVDGEIAPMRSPLDYRIARNALRVAAPPPDSAASTGKNR
jgi:diacylglycerol kinase family enzyme